MTRTSPPVAARPRTLGAALAHGRATLANHRCPRTDAAREAQDLLAAAARVTREELFLRPERPLPLAAWRRYDAWLGRRLKHEPLDYLLSFTPFLGRDFLVSRATLIPRVATENLVTAALDVIRALPPTERPLVIDVGTGSGAIAITLAAELPRHEVIATDVSAAALARARRNAVRLGPLPNLEFRRGHLLAPALRGQPTDRPVIIVTNPPYLTAAQIRRLQPEIRLYEPYGALDGGGRDGLDCYRGLLDQLQTSGHRRFIMVGEHLAGQQRRLAAEVTRRFPTATSVPIRNLAGVVIGTKSQVL